MIHDESPPVDPPVIDAPSEDPPTGKQLIESPEPFGAPFGRPHSGTPSTIATRSLEELSPAFEADVNKIEELLASDDEQGGNLEAVIQANRVEDLPDSPSAPGGEGVESVANADPGTAEVSSAPHALALSTLLGASLLRLRRQPHKPS